MATRTAKPRKASASTSTRKATRARTAPARTAPPTKVTLLAGGNPQVAKADGDGPVQAYIAAMPSWKRDVGQRLDALIARTVPRACKAVKWNSPMYGIEGQGWFVSFHVFTHYVKVTFFKGVSLRPEPPAGTAKDARSIDIHEGDFDEAQLASWIRQAAAMPGWGSVEPQPKKAAASSSTSTTPPAKRGPTALAGASEASRLIGQRIVELGGWRGDTLARVRAVILAADSAIVEEWKWNVPVWSRGGIICTGEAYKNAVKLTFAKGAALKDPARLFNSSLEGNTRRAIDIREGDAINERALAALVRAAAALNTSTPPR